MTDRDTDDADADSGGGHDSDVDASAFTTDPGSDEGAETDTGADSGGQDVAADDDQVVDPGRPFRRPGEVDDEESRVITYGVPFLAALLVSVGIAGAALGGWAVVQPAVDGCENPVVTVSTPEETDERLADDRWAETVERLEFEELTPAEQRAFLEAVDSPRREGTVRGAFDNSAAFQQGVVVTHDGTDRYATVVSMNECLGVDPLLLPLGIVTLLLGLVAFAYLWYRFGTRPPAEWGIG